jgi:rubrerythrin
MAVTRIQYLEEYLDCVDLVAAGKKGAIADNKYLAANYCPEYYSIISNHLRSNDKNVRAETVLLLSKLGDRQALDIVTKMRTEDCEYVSAACLAYLDSVAFADGGIPKLIDTLQHCNGDDFMKAAAKIRAVGRASDVPALRKIYGQVDGEMQTAMKLALASIIGRNPELRPKTELILSVPIYPDENKFMKFADDMTVYFDIRYRDNVVPLGELTVRMYNNVAHAIVKTQIRLFNEKDNLSFYSKKAEKAHSDLSDLLLWAVDDFKTKRVKEPTAEARLHVCRECGECMVLTEDAWICPICGAHE